MKKASKTGASGFAIVRPASLTAAVVERLRMAIVDAEFPLGAELSELGLAASFGVSRTPVREALATLQLQGMVDIVPQKGSYVFFPTEKQLADLCDYRVLIELRAMRLSHGHDRAGTLADLEQALAGMTAARESDDPRGYARADEALHEAFFTHCDNSYLQEAYRMVSGRIATLRTHLSVPRPDVRERSFDEHRRIVSAYAGGDLDGLDALLLTHIEQTRDRYVEALRCGIGGASA